MTSSIRTTDIYGKGFIVEDVPAFLDEACKARPWLVFKGKAAAERKADAEALWHARVEIEGVEGVVATQIEGFDGLWFVVQIYTAEAAAKQAAYEARLATNARR